MQVEKVKITVLGQSSFTDHISLQPVRQLPLNSVSLVFVLVFVDNYSQLKNRIYEEK